MRRSFSMVWAGLACVVFLASGCGNDPFGPPSRVKRASTTSESSRSKPNYLVFVVPGPPAGDLEMWGSRAQHEASLKRVIFRVMGPSPSETAAEQPAIVRKAVADGATALVVYPGDSPELPKVLAEAEAKGVAVVLLEKGIAAPEGSKPFTLVEYPPFDDTAKQIVAATIEDLKAAKQPTNGTAIILSDKLVDSTSARRVAALKSAAEAAKFRQVVTISFDSSNQIQAKATVVEAVKANPDVSVILTDDGEGMVLGALARVEFKGKPIFFVGGYTDFRTSPVTTAPSRESCNVEGRFTELGSLAVNTALAKLKGESVGEHAYLTPRFNKTEGVVSSETEPNSSFPEVIRQGITDRTPKKEEPAKAEPPKEGAGKP